MTGPPDGTGHQPARVVRSIAGREVALDAEGFFLDFKDWSEEAALALAREAGLAELDQAQWRIIRFLREYYAANGRAPLNRGLKTGLGLSLMEMEGLFPGGIKHGARRLAGLPNPRSCG